MLWYKTYTISYTISGPLIWLDESGKLTASDFMSDEWVSELFIKMICSKHTDSFRNQTSDSLRSIWKGSSLFLIG